ncbi:unnamed protein product [Pedinophyceae sp. YPF-701]|nr:unnamed protein product [Pedinophyceae sp. YPF-701]
MMLVIRGAAAQGSRWRLDRSNAACLINVGCNTTLTFDTTLSPFNGAFDEQIVLGQGTSITASNGAQYFLDEDLTLRLSSREAFQTTYYLGSVFKNYLAVKGLGEEAVPSCATATIDRSTQRCCSASNTLYTLKTVETLDLWGFEGVTTRAFSFDVGAQKGFRTAAARMESAAQDSLTDLDSPFPTDLSSPAPGIPYLSAVFAGGPKDEVRMPKLDLPPMWAVGVAAAPEEPLVLLESQYIGSSHGKVGMSAESWTAWWDANGGCSNPEESVRIAGGSASDQLSAFRTRTFAEVMAPEGRTCEPVRGPQYTLADPAKANSAAGENRQTIACDHGGSLSLQVQVDVGFFNVSVGAPQLAVRDFGSLPWSPGGTSTTLFVELANEGDADGTYTVTTEQCCADGDCGGGVVAISDVRQEAVIASGGFRRFTYLVSTPQVVETTKTIVCRFTASMAGNFEPIPVSVQLLALPPTPTQPPTTQGPATTAARPTSPPRTEPVQNATVGPTPTPAPPAPTDAPAAFAGPRYVAAVLSLTADPLEPLTPTSLGVIQTAVSSVIPGVSRDDVFVAAGGLRRTLLAPSTRLAGVEISGAAVLVDADAVASALVDAASSGSLALVLGALGMPDVSVVIVSGPNTVAGPGRAANVTLGQRVEVGGEQTSAGGSDKWDPSAFSMSGFGLLITMMLVILAVSVGVAGTVIYVRRKRRSRAELDGVDADPEAYEYDTQHSGAPMMGAYGAEQYELDASFNPHLQPHVGADTLSVHNVSMGFQHGAAIDHLPEEVLDPALDPMLDESASVAPSRAPPPSMAGRSIAPPASMAARSFVPPMSVAGRSYAPSAAGRSMAARTVAAHAHGSIARAHGALAARGRGPMGAPSAVGSHRSSRRHG